jgi:hypothetical protein
VSLSPSITRPFDAPEFLFTVRCRHPARGHCFARVSYTVSTPLSGPTSGTLRLPVSRCYIHQRTTFHFYPKISGHDRTHPTTRVAVHSITKEKIEKTSTVTFLFNMKLIHLLEQFFYFLMYESRESIKTIAYLPMHGDQQRIVY